MLGLDCNGRLDLAALRQSEMANNRDLSCFALFSANRRGQQIGGFDRAAQQRSILSSRQKSQGLPRWANYNYL
jgi:hypothetical protein